MNNQKLSKSDSLAIIKTRILMRIEQYNNEKERLKGVRDSYSTKADREYFQGHIDAIEGFIIDLKELLN